MDRQSSATILEVFQLHLEAGSVTRKAIEFACRCSQSTVQRWVNGECVPDFYEVGMLLQNLPAAVADDLLSALLINTPYTFGRAANADPDLNRDGKVDHADVLMQTSRTTDAAQGVLREICAALDDGRIGHDELTVIQSKVNELIRQSQHAGVVAAANANQGLRLRRA